MFNSGILVSIATRIITTLAVIPSPPEGILTRFRDTFGETEEATAVEAERLLRDLGW